MRFNAALASAVISYATLLGYAHAEETQAAPDATTSVIEKPTFTVRFLRDCRNLSSSAIADNTLAH